MKASFVIANLNFRSKYLERRELRVYVARRLPHLGLDLLLRLHSPHPFLPGNTLTQIEQL